MRPLLFDIDGTLLDSQGIGRKPMETALAEVYGRFFDLSGIDWSGRTDLDIIHEVLTANGMGPEGHEQRISEVFHTFTGLLHENLRAGTSKVKVLPGVNALLDRLALTKVPMGLLTGNVETAAWHKLESAGLDPYFHRKTGAYGSERRIRAELVPLARSRLKKVYGIDTKPLIIGDSWRDVECARASGVPCLTVATGRMDVNGLKAAGADIVVDSLEDTDHILRLIDGFGEAQ